MDRNEHFDRRSLEDTKRQLTAREYLEVESREGYWNADRFKDQMSKAIDIFNSKYPGCEALFVLDNRPCHRRNPSDALNAQAMNKGPGGKQRVMHETQWDGKAQS